MSQIDGASSPSARFRLRGHPSEVSYARRLVGEFLGSVSDEVAATAQLLTSEVVSNAFEHARGHVTLSLDRADGLLRVRVTDASSGRPELQRAPVASERGRGLLIVESLAASWGVEVAGLGPGKTVWFTLRTC